MAFNYLAPPALAQDSPLVRLLKNGRIPDERQGAVLDMIAKRGSPPDLRYVFDRTRQPEGFTPSVRQLALTALRESQRNRRTLPEGDLTTINTLLGDDIQPQVRAAAIELAAAWRVAESTQTIIAIASNADAPETVRTAAISALGELGNQESLAALNTLIAASVPASIRNTAIAALARHDLAAAASLAAEELSQTEDIDSAQIMLAAILARQDGGESLARAVESAAFSPDAARRSLRLMYVLGRADASLVAALSKAAGLDAEVKPLTDSEMKSLVETVMQQGDPARGEAVFRRADLNCTGCHAIGGAGGNVGPDLGPLGTTSPPDYIIRAIMQPDESIKEQYQTLTIATTDGQVLQGIVTDKDDQRIILKQADGSQRSVPAADIDEQRPGGSLMPKGLSNLITQAEFIDLVRFLSELGKPGAFELSATPTLKTWSVLKSLPSSLADPLPPGAILPTPIADAPQDQWSTLLATVAGFVLLDEARDVSKNNIVFMKSNIEVTSPGAVRIRFDSTVGASVWVDGLSKRLEADALEVKLDRGVHTLTLRVDLSSRQSRELRVTLEKPDLTPAEFTVVNGR